MSWPRLTLILQLVFFAGWTVKEELHRHGARRIVLETVPVDPRDLWAGQYMDLAYTVSRPPPEMTLPPTGDVVVHLTTQRTRTIDGTTYEVYDIAAVASEVPPDAGDALWVRGELRHGRLTYGIERFYFNESRAFELGNAARPDETLVEARVGSDGAMRLERLIYPQAADDAATP